MTPAEHESGITWPAQRAQVRLRLLHAGGLTFFAVCASTMPELRASPLGLALWIGIAGALVLLTLGMGARWLGWSRQVRARPVFSVHTWLGLLMLGVGAFGMAEGWNSNLPGTFVTLPGIAAPVSRQFFVIACIFGGSVLYGALAVALGSGLAIRYPPIPSRGQALR